MDDECYCRCCPPEAWSSESPGPVSHHCAGVAHYVFFHLSQEQSPSSVAHQLQRRLSPNTLKAIYDDIVQSFDNPVEVPAHSGADVGSNSDFAYRQPFSLFPTTIDSLPAEVLAYIFSKLTGATLVRASGVCRAWRTLGRDHLVWLHVDRVTHSVKDPGNPAALTAALLVWADVEPVRTSILSALRTTPVEHARAVAAAAHTRRYLDWAVSELSHISSPDASFAALSWTPLITLLDPRSAGDKRLAELAKKLCALSVQAKQTTMSESTRGPICTAVVVRTIVRAFSECLDTHEFVEHTVRLISSFLHKDMIIAPPATMVIEADLFPAVQVTLKRWPNNKEIRNALFRLLRNASACRNGCGLAALESGCIATMVSAEKPDQEVLESALSCFSSITQEGHALQLANTPGVINLLARHIGVAPNVAFAVLARMVRFGEEVCERILATEVIVSIPMEIRRPPVTETGRMCALDFLTTIVNELPDKGGPAVCSGPILRMASALLRSTGQNPNLREAAARLLRLIVARPEGMLEWAKVTRDP